MFFNKKKMRKEKVKETKEKMKTLFEKKVKDFENYKLLYGYKETLERNGYTYQSKIIAYREDDLTIIILDTDKDFKKVKHLKKYKKGEFKKASYSKGKDLYTIEKTELKSDKEEFTLISKNYEDEDLIAFISQEDEIEDFKEFFQEFKHKPIIKVKKDDKKKTKK